MHTFSETGTGVPAFLAKLWRLVEDPETNNLICWSKDGRSFIIQNQAQFARELLPLNYKHNNMASFIRQLNMYGFHKITSIDNGGLKFDRDEMEFTHPCFKRNCPYLLEHIKRKIASNKSVDEKSALKPEAVTKVLQDVKAMRGRQDSLDSRFSVMKQENEALWREIASLRQKHAKQQQIVNKLIQFLITIVQPQRNMTSVKRHMQLMINDIPNKSKMRKTSESERDSGPVIHELGEDLQDEVPEIEPEIMMPTSPFARVATPSTPMNDPEIPHSPSNVGDTDSNVDMTTSQNFDFSNQCAEDLGEYLNPSAAASTVVNDGLIQTVNNDGSKIFYHITEVPDAPSTDSNIDTAVSFNEDNVLTTPMVRKEMARNQLMKLKNRQKRYKNVNPERIEADVTSQQQSPPKQQVVHPQSIRIKSEQDPAVDSMLFLDIYPNNSGMTPDPNIISPNFSEDSHQSNSNNNDSFLISAKTASPSENDFFAGNNSDLYNTNSFIANDIPADIFEDNSLNSGEGNSHMTENTSFKRGQKLQLGNSVANKGKFSTYLSEPTSENELEPSTSAAAAAAVANSLSNNRNNNKNNDVKNAVATPISSTPSLKIENSRNMALAKCNNHKDYMREEVSGHLDIVQDELEGLKDLLRSDGYSLDQNTLLGIPKSNAFVNNNHQMSLPPALEEDILNKLFNDSDILEPYGLHLCVDDSEGNDNKKGSELMTYQPMYDLSDIINDQNNLDVDASIPTTSASQAQQQSKEEFNNSVLNTPYHE